jgi:DNA-binding SARP family transcriptional activator/DNA polymerase III delta prime subunit
MCTGRTSFPAKHAMQHHSSDSDPQRSEPAKARIQIFTFGTLQVIRDETAVTESDWHTRQARQLLKILITERPRPVSTDLLIEILWPNSTPHAAATTLRSAINALRNVLEPDRPNRAPSRYIVTQAPGYAFHLAPEIWLDVEEFDHLYHRAHNTADSGLRLHLLEQAIDLYADDYLISDPYADWLQAERERLRERFFNALLMVADIYAETGHYADAIVACRRMLARDEVRENAYQSLMRFQAESGDSAGALLTYERCRTILSEELGADPSPLTQTLHQRILNGDIEPRPVIHMPLNPISSASDDNAQRAGACQPVDLPALTLFTVLDAGFPAVFVGRVQEMTTLQERLQHALRGRGEWLLMQGEAGVGKTRLAYQLLRQAGKEDATVISATCQALERDLPFAPLADALGRYFYSLPDAVVQSLPAGTLGALAQIIPSLHDRLLYAPPAPSESASNAEENRQRLIDSIVTTIVVLAKLRPLVFFVDDLQWADPDTLAVLNRLVQRLPELPAFLLMAYRAEDLPENSALVTFTHTLNRLQRDAQLSVPRFARRHVQELVERHLAAPHTSEHTLTPDAAYRLGDMLYETTQGNALFVTEALHNLDERLASQRQRCTDRDLRRTGARQSATGADDPQPAHPGNHPGAPRPPADGGARRAQPVRRDRARLQPGFAGERRHPRPAGRIGGAAQSQIPDRAPRRAHRLRPSPGAADRLRQPESAAAAAAASGGGGGVGGSGARRHQSGRNFVSLCPGGRWASSVGGAIWRASG